MGMRRLLRAGGMRMGHHVTIMCHINTRREGPLTHPLVIPCIWGLMVISLEWFYKILCDYVFWAGRAKIEGRRHADPKVKSAPEYYRCVYMMSRGRALALSRPTVLQIRETPSQDVPFLRSGATQLP